MCSTLLSKMFFLFRAYLTMPILADSGNISSMQSPTDHTEYAQNNPLKHFC
jgi:hypothetical protein